MRKLAQDAELGRRVKALRVLRGWSQEALAKRAHVDRRTISRLERGGGVLPMTLRAVGRLLGVRFDDDAPTGDPPQPGITDETFYDTGSYRDADEWCESPASEANQSNRLDDSPSDAA